MAELLAKLRFPSCGDIIPRGTEYTPPGGLMELISNETTSLQAIADSQKMSKRGAYLMTHRGLSGYIGR
jgi:hypothetical protein